MTALHWAAFDGQEAIVRLLLEAGAWVKTKSSLGSDMAITIKS